MSIEWMDGPDHYGTNVSLLTQGPYASAAGLFLGKNMGPNGVGTVFRFNGAGVGFRKVRPASRKELGLGMRIFLPVGLPVRNFGTALAQYLDVTNSTIATLYLQSTGALQLITNGGTLVFDSGPVIVGQSWQHIEIYFEASTNNNGSVRVNINGLPIYSQDGLTTTTNAGSIAQWGMTTALNDVELRVRDIYTWNTLGTVNNAGMQGDREVLTSFMNLDGPEQDWAYSAGASGWPLISNNPPDDTQFVFADSAGGKSDFGMEPIDTAITSISAVRIAARAFKSDSGIGTMSLGIKSGGVSSAGTEQSISTEPIFYSQVVELDPQTGVRFTPTRLNAALAEIVRVQ